MMKTDSKSDEFSRWAFGHIQWCQKLKELVHPDMSVTQVQIILLVAREPGISTQEILMQLGCTAAALSRNMRTLNVWYDKDKKTGEEVKKGYELIDPMKDPRERRALNYYLTKKGRHVVDTLWHLMQQQLEMESKQGESKHEGMSAQKTPAIDEGRV